MVIRASQMEALEKSAADNFVDFTLEHLKEYFPRQCETLGDEHMRGIIRYSWDRAKTYDVFSERGVWQFTDLSLMLGHSFDNDPKFPWVPEMLEDRTNDEIPRMEALFQHGVDYGEDVKKDFPVGGADPARLRAAIKRMRQETDAPLNESAFPAFSQEIARDLRSFFPVTCENIGEQPLLQSIESGCFASQRYGLTTRRSIGIYSTLSLLLGCGFVTDLQYPWSAATLSDKSIPKVADRADLLFGKALEEIKPLVEAG